MTSQKRPLPWWSKLLMAVSLLTITGFFVSGISCILTMKQIATDAIDPQAVKRAAHDIGAFPDPLPEGFQYVIAIDLPIVDLDIVQIEHKPDRQLFTFIGSDAQEDAKAMLDRGYATGLNMLTPGARFTEVKQTGSLKVAGHDMPYIIGDTLDSFTDKKGRGLVGCIQIPLKDTRKNILIYALQSTDVPYNQQITLDLLNSIKSI